MTKHYTDEGTLLIRNSDIKDGKFEFGDNPIYLEKTFAEKNETRMHQIGDVITVHTGDVGTSAVITENEAKSIGFATIVTRPNPKIIDSNYLCSFLNTDKHKKWAVSISTGDGRTNYNLGDYFELVVPVPSIAEQKRIASYIQKLNRLITLHQREFVFLCKEKIEIIRYIKNTWEQRKLGELSSSFEYGLNAAAKEYDGENKYIRITDIDDDSRVFKQEDITSPDTDLSSAENYRLSEGDILFARTGASVGKNYIYKASDGLVYYAGFLIRARIKSEYNAEFVFQNTLTGDYEKFIKVTSMRSGQPGVNAQEYSQYQIMVPSKPEQDKISDCFRNLDHLITLHQRKPNFYTGGYYAE